MNKFQNEDQLISGPISTTVQYMNDSISLNLRQTHATVTRIHISCCAVQVVSKSFRKYCECQFYGFFILTWDAYLSSIFARSSVHARNKLLRYAKCMKVKVFRR